MSDPYSFPETAATPAEETLTTRDNGRLMRYRFTSNTAGGSYQWGKLVAHLQTGDGRITS